MHSGFVLIADARSTEWVTWTEAGILWKPSQLEGMNV